MKIKTIDPNGSARPFARQKCSWAMSLLAVLAAAAVAQAQPAAGPPAGSGDQEKVLAIVGADVHTVTHEVVRRGTILIKAGKIVEVGQQVAVPDGAEVIDAKGKVVCPGFVVLGMSGIGLRTAPGGEGPGTADVSDSLDPFDRNIKLALGVGITSGSVQMGGFGGRFRRGPSEYFPGLEDPQYLSEEELTQAEIDFGHAESVCSCCGLPILPREPPPDGPPAGPPQQTQPQRQPVIKMTFGTLSGMLVSPNAVFDAPPGMLRGALAQHQWRRQVKEARDYLKASEAYEAGGRQGQPPRRTASDELLDVVAKKISLRTRAETVTEIRQQIALARELDYKLILDGATEAWRIADELAESDVPVVITPRNRRAPRIGEEETSGSWIEMPGILEEAGVPFAVSALSGSISLNGIAGRDLSSLPMEAAFAVRGGATEPRALAALTIVPARLLGLDQRIGSIEQGKDADLLILDGQPLDYRTYVETAIVNGRVVYLREVDRVWPVFDRSAPNPAIDSN
jgi:hypothetical protein